MKLNVLGDITGFAATLKALMDQMPKDKLWGLGDLIDRGPDSKGVLDFFIDNGHESIMGNHEHMMLFEKIRNNPDVHHRLYPPRCWMYNGGGETLDSFGVHHQGEFDVSKFEKYFNFIENMPLQQNIDDLILTHAPINDKKHKAAFNIKEINLDPYLLEVSILWNRHSPRKIDGKFQVYGHNSTKGILWHTDKNPQGIYMHDQLEVPDLAWGVCIDTWRKGYLTGLNIDTELLSNPKEAIKIFIQPLVDSDVQALKESNGK